MTKLTFRPGTRTAGAVLLCMLATGHAFAEESAAGGPAVRGVIRAMNRLEIRSDLGVPVLHAPFRKGMAFRKDDILVAFDCDRLDAERRAADAAAASAAVELRQKQKLLKHGAAGKGEVELASAASAKSGAERKVVEARMAACEIRAPFDGIIADSKAQRMQLPAGTEPLIVAVDISAFEVEMVMPSNWLAEIKPGGSFAMTIDETGETLAGTVERFGAEVDAVSQTIEVIGKLGPSATNVRPGMSGDVVFDGKTKGGT